MPGFEQFGKVLIFIGVFIIVAGLLLVFWSKIPVLGRLPGDIFIEKDNFRFFFPIATSLVISLVLTVILNIVIRLFGK